MQGYAYRFFAGEAVDLEDCGKARLLSKRVGSTLSPIEPTVLSSERPRR
jgi:hypothetical protein